MNAPTSEETAAREVEAIVDGLDVVIPSNVLPELEPEEEDHRPREPLIGVLQSLNPVCHHLTCFP